MKVHINFKNSLPFKEQPQRSLSAYKASQDQTHNGKINQLTRHVDSPEKNTPFFHILNSQQVAFKLRYTDVVLSVVRQVLLIYNKLTEISQVTNRSMFMTLNNNL